MIEKLMTNRNMGHVVIEDEVYENVDFHKFVFLPSDESSLVFRNCVFKNCKVKTMFFIGGNVFFENVVFENMMVFGDYKIDPGAKFYNVVFSGGLSGSTFWVGGVPDKIPHIDNSIDIDISSLNTYIIIIGNDVSKVKTDAGKHLFLNKSLLDHGGRALSRGNFFRSCAERLKSYGTDIGVFSYVGEEKFSGDFKKELEHFISLRLVAYQYSDLCS